MPDSIDAAILLDPGGTLAVGGPARLTLAGGRIARIEPGNAGGGLLAMPAPANAHDHGRGLRTLGFGADDDALEIWLSGLAREPRVSAYHRAVVAFARMAEGGIAATNHSHGTQDAAGVLDEAAAVSRAARDVGIRVAFAAPFIDRNPVVYGDHAGIPGLGQAPGRPMAQVGPYLDSVAAMAAHEHAGFAVQFCPVGPQWVSDAAMAAIAQASAQTGRCVHMHLLETRTQREWADHAYPGGLLRHLDAVGLLSPRLSVAHGVYLRPDEADLLAERGVIVSVNTSSNLRLRSGIAPVGDFLRAGLRFGIGLDAQPLDDDDDILREMRLVWLHHRGFGHADVLGRDRLFRAALVDGRRAVLGDDGGGRLQPGAPADLLLLDHARIAHDQLADAADPVTALLARATRRHITRLIVAGRTVVQDGRCVTVDRAALEAELLAEARAAWRRAPPDDAGRPALHRALRQFYGCGCHMGRPFAAT